MTPLDRQLDRASRVRVLSAPVQGAPAYPSAGGSAQQADPDDARHVTNPLAGSALYGCTCGHSRHAHQAYAHCQIPGCTCWTYTRNAPAAAGTARGHEQEGTS